MSKANDTQRRRGSGGGRRVARVVVSIAACLVLIGAAATASYAIFASEPTAQREGATRRSAALVETVTVQRGDHRPLLTVLGRVEPARDVLLSPRVSGQIIAVEPEFRPGGIVSEGQPLVRIDPADFERVLAIRRSELRQIEAELAIEEGQQRVARQEFELLGEEVDPENRALILREPQIAAIRARISAAEEAVRQAQLDLDRATVSAPFDAHVLSRSVNVGSQVAPGDELARLVGVEEYWVVASVALRDLPWLQFSSDNGGADGASQEGGAATVRHTTAWPPGDRREARLERLIGLVDDQTRMARVLVTVPDPLGRETERPALVLGTIVQVQIEARPIEGVIRLDREYLRQNDTVWVMADGKLEIRDVEVVYRNAEHAYIRTGLDSEEEVVTTSLATVTPGLALRRAGDEPGPGADGPRTPPAADDEGATAP